MPLPVFLLAFANEQQDRSRYLRNLPLELNRLRAALEKAEDRGLCELVILSNATLDQLIDTFQREKYRNRIAFLHYGGHANSYQLLLESVGRKTQTAYGEGLVPFLAAQKGLQCIFLNGCFSAQQAQELTARGVPAVIGTAQAVDDEVATELAAAFYSAMGEGIPLDQAWLQATHKIKAQKGTQDLDSYYRQESISRGAAFAGYEVRSQFPWEIYYRPGAELIRDWNLPAAANDPYFGLPELPQRYHLPDRPYRFLERYKKEDARIFFGRGRYIRDLYHRLTSPHAAPAILLYGQSGVGKSSLLEAGLFPRLESEYDLFFVRRDPEKGLSQHLFEALECTEEATDASTLLRQWRDLEAASGKKGLHIVIDQVEEVFTRHNEEQPDELEKFLQLVASLFAQLEDRPRGKLLLSYRKEYDPEIEKACREAGLPKEKVFLDRLDRPAVLEIISGLTSRPALQNKYRLTVEDNLPVLIADDLLVDKDSPIAPVLQIILTRLWQEEEANDQRHFSTDTYNDLRKKGIFLDDFFHQQMAELRHWEEQVQQSLEDSGLALDVLHFHTTSLGTAERRNLDELRRQYQHRSDVIEQLIQQFRSLYLLTALGRDQSSLAHDTLAPVVIKELNKSEKPGQRAFRILVAKMMDYDISPKQAYLDEEDLALVEKGAGGMRMWTSKEKELIEKSRRRRARLAAERRRSRNIKIGGMAAIILLALASYFLWAQFSVQAKINRATRLAETDATQTLQIVRDILRSNPKNEEANLLLEEVLQDNEFYESLPIDPTSIVSYLQVSFKSSQLLAARGEEASIWDLSPAGKNDPLFTFPHPGWVFSAAFSGDEQYVLTACDDPYVRLWNKDDPMRPEKFEGDSTFYAAVFSPDEQRIYGGGESGRIFRWNRYENRENTSAWPAHRGAVSALAFDTRGRLLSGGFDDSMIYLWDVDNQTLQDSFFYAGNGVNSLVYDPEGNSILAGYFNGAALLWKIDNRSYIQLEQRIVAHTPGLQINSVAFSPGGKYMLTAGRDQRVKLWDRRGNLINTFRGHKGFVQTVAFLSDSTFISGGEDKKIKRWSALKPQTFEHANSAVVATFSTSGRQIMTGNDKNAYLWSVDGDRVRDFKHGHADLISCVSVAPGDSLFLTGSEDGTVVVWNSSGDAILTFTGHRDAVSAVAFAPDGTYIASGSSDSLVLLWDLRGQIMDTLEHPFSVNSLAFSPDGTQLLTGGSGKLVRLWNRTDESFIDLPVPSGDLTTVNAVAFSADGQLIAAAGTMGAKFTGWVLVMNKDGDEKYSTAGGLSLPAHPYTTLAFSSDGSLLLLGAGDGIAQILNLDEGGQLIRSFDDFVGSPIFTVRFSPAGDRYILISGNNGRAGLFYNTISRPNR